MSGVEILEVVLWDDRHTRVMAELSFKTPVKSVKPDAQRSQTSRWRIRPFNFWEGWAPKSTTVGAWGI